MKKIYILMQLALVAFFCISCTQEESQLDIYNESETIEVGPEASTEVLYFSTNVDWTAKENADWLKLSQIKGEAGNQELVLKISENTDYDPRHAYVMISAEDKTVKFTIEQTEKKGFILSETNFSIGSEGGTLTVPVKANAKYKCRVSPECMSWLSISRTRSLTEHQETITVQPNEDYVARSGQIKIIYGEEESLITVTQSQLDELIVSEKNFDMPQKGGKLDIIIQTNTKYTSTVLDNAKEWISIEQTRVQELDDHKLTLNISTNEDFESRTGQVKISGAGKESFITITQAQKDAIIIEKTEYEIGKQGNSFSIPVRSNIPYQVKVKEDAQSWLHIIQTKGTDQSEIAVTVDENKSYDPRTGTILVEATNGDMAMTITIRQTENKALFIDQDEFRINYKKQYIEIPVQTNLDYTVKVPAQDQNWLQILNTRGLANYTILLNCSENKSTGSRQSTLTIEASGHKASIRIIQSAKPCPQKVDLGLSVQWSDFNLGADKPEEPGKYYAWGELNGYTRTEGHSFYWSNYLSSEGGSMSSYTSAGTSADPLREFVYPNQVNLDMAHDAAHHELGDLWRMPTNAELNELFANCQVEEVTRNLVRGYLFTSRINQNTIFIPASGYINGNELTTPNFVSFWTSTPGKTQAHYAIHMLESLHDQDIGRFIGVPIRPVYGKEKKAPQVSLTSIQVSDKSVTVKGQIDNDGGAPILEKGFLYSTSSTPVEQNSTIVNCQSANFQSIITGLEPKTTYYIRAFARNEIGTTYSTISSFKTPMASFLEIATEAELRAFAEMVDTTSKPLYAKLVADIHLTKYWIAMGDEKNPFRGIFDGNHHRIEKISPRGSNSGLFGIISNATIKNLSVDGTFESGTNIGGIAGKAISSTIDNCHSDLYSNVGGTVGGIVGLAQDCIIKNCSHGALAIGNTSASNIGGIAGKSERSKIYNCYNQGDIYGSDSYAGIVGYQDQSSSVTNCYNTGNFPDMPFIDTAGGIVGYNCGSVTNCYNAGVMHGRRINGDQNLSMSGGVVGYNHIDSSCEYSYFLKDHRINTDFDYVGDLNWGTCHKCGSFNQAGEFTSSSISYNGNTPYLSVSLNQWVENNNSENKYKSWIVRNELPEFQN